MVRQSFEYSAASVASNAATVIVVFGTRPEQTSAKIASRRGRSVTIRFIVNFIQGLNHPEHIAHRVPSLLQFRSFVSKSSERSVGCWQKRGQLYKSNRAMLLKEHRPIGKGSKPGVIRRHVPCVGLGLCDMADTGQPRLWCQPAALWPLPAQSRAEQSGLNGSHRRQR